MRYQETNHFKGPYAPAILRFSITFPTNYPQSPPTLTFQTDIFHSLVTPLTTYTYTTGSHSNDTVSAGDDERLPPGSFSLGHGFPSWYGRKRDDRADMRRIPHSNHRSRDSPSVSPAFQEIDVDKGASFSMTAPGPPVSDAATASKRAQQISNREASIAEVLDYVKRSFDEEDFLDTLPLEAAGNPGAWKAWKSHRSSSTALAEGGSTTFTDSPEEWKWDGVWEQRVRRGIDASISDSVLFGTNQDDDGVRSLTFC